MTEHSDPRVQTTQELTLARLGLKGPNAAAWLQQRGVAIPEHPNSWIATSADEQDIVVRLGATEFFLENLPSARMQALAIELAAPLPGVYPVLREDRAFVLGGESADGAVRDRTRPPHGPHECAAHVRRRDRHGRSLRA